MRGSLYNDTLVGNAGVNVLEGGSGRDSLGGKRGEDILDGGLGDAADVLIGGKVNDLLLGNLGDDFFRFEAGWGTDTIMDFASIGAEKIVFRVDGIKSLAALTCQHGTFHGVHQSTTLQGVQF